MTSSDVLLLRTFKDDLKSVNREQSAWAGLFRIYMWLFTLEQLITNRLRYLGKVRLLDIDRENKELLEKRWIKRVVASQVVKKFLLAIVPALVIKLPAEGGIRYYIDTQKDPFVWRPDVAQAMGTARMVVVLLGTSTDSLAWEMEQIQKSRLLEKTIFVMPPGIRKRHYRARWEQFTKYLNDNGNYDLEPLKKVKPQRVLAACVHDDTLLVITGKRGSQLFYEAAIDIATLFTITDAAHRRRLIYKYLD